MLYSKLLICLLTSFITVSCQTLRTVTAENAPAPWNKWEVYNAYRVVWDCLKAQPGYAGIRYNLDHTKETYFKSGSGFALRQCTDDTSYNVIQTTHSVQDLIVLETNIRERLDNSGLNFSVSVIHYGQDHSPKPENLQFARDGGYVFIHLHPRDLTSARDYLKDMKPKRFEITPYDDNDEVFVTSP